MPNFNENNIGFTKFCQENVTEVPHRSQPLINFAWSLTTEQPVLRARSSQNVHLLTYPVKENIQDVI
jgi:hypothetical protein